MKVFKRSILTRFSIKQLFTMILLIFCLFSIFVIYDQINYPITQSKMAKFHFSQPGDLPEINGFSPRHFHFIDLEETKKLEVMSRQAVPPIYFFNQKVSVKSIKLFNQFRKSYIALIEQGLSFNEIEKQLNRSGSPAMPAYLLENIEKSGQRDLIFDLSYQALDRLSQKMLFSFDEKEIHPVKYGSKIRVIKKGSLYDEVVLESSLSVRSHLDEEISLLRQKVSAETLGNCASIIALFIAPNCFYDSELTRKAKFQATQTVHPIQINIAKGELLFVKGKPLSVTQVKKIEALKSIGARFEWLKITFLFIYLIILAFFSLILFHFPFINRALKFNEIAIMQGLLLGGVFYSILVARLVPDFMQDLTFYFPIPLMVIVVSVMLTPRGGFFFGLIYLLIQPLFQLFASSGGFDARLFLTASILFGVFPTLSSAWLVRKLKTLFDFLKSGIFVTGIIFCLSFVFLLLLQPFRFDYYQVVLVVTLNSFIVTLMAPGLVLLFERFFNILTMHRLVELADTSQPIFKKMISRAPGTYSHSMSVANLAESACQAIGANGLLARVGGYYHDIGKIDQPEYYTENQKFENKHDILKPNLSVTVIKSHIKKGADKAKQLKLPQEVIDIIEQHHGNSLILYFYTQAMLGQQKNSILKDDYRYDNPLPHSIEAAVVMLADCVEAATRSLKNPTPGQLEKFIWKIMLDKMNKEQLNASPLTFLDLQKIKEVFVSILNGQYHTRVEYPLAENNQEGKKDEGKKKSE